MTIVYSLPTQPMQNNVKKSLEYLNYESKFEAYHNEPYLHIDTTTDRVMLNIATYTADYSIIKNAFGNYWHYDENSNLLGLDNSIMGDVSNGVEVNYARYWGGYCVYLKPLLLLFTYPEIRVINAAFQLMLIIVVGVLLYERVGKKYLLPLLLCLIVLNPLTTMRSLQYSDIFSVSMITMIALLLLNDRMKKNEILYSVVFVIDGIAVAFLDFLTYPFVALGLPLITYLLINRKSLKAEIKEIIKFSCCWGIGYGGMWIGKWIVSTIFTGMNIIQDGLNSLMFRTSGEWENSQMTFSNAIRTNYSELSGVEFKFILLIVAVVIVLGIIVKAWSFDFRKIRDNIPILLVSLYPFAWYGVVKNHSIIHYWMTYREYSIFVLGVACVIVGCIVNRSDLSLSTCRSGTDEQERFRK